jgi:hypothetical protein
MPCTQCIADPSTHSFEKIGEFYRTSRTHIFYTSYKSIKDYTNSVAITHHITDALAGISGESWVWIMDCKFIQAKHMLQLNVSLKLLKLLREHYGSSLSALYLVNSGAIINTAMTTLGPFMNREFREAIRKITGSPLELLEKFTKTHHWNQTEIDPVIRRLVVDYA